MTQKEVIQIAKGTEKEQIKIKCAHRSPQGVKAEELSQDCRSGCALRSGSSGCGAP